MHDTHNIKIVNAQLARTVYNFKDIKLTSVAYIPVQVRLVL